MTVRRGLICLPDVIEVRVVIGRPSESDGEKRLIVWIVSTFYRQFKSVLHLVVALNWHPLHVVASPPFGRCALGKLLPKAKQLAH